MKIIIKESKKVLSEDQRACTSLHEEISRIQRINEEIDAQLLEEAEEEPVPPTEPVKGQNLIPFEKKHQENIRHWALDLAGLVPGIGEFADLYNAILYIRKGEWLMAGFSLISMLPGLGDVIGKGGKIATLLARAGANPQKIARAIRGTRKLLLKHSDKIKGVLRKFEDNEKLGPHIPKLEMAIDAFLGAKNRRELAKGVAQAASVKEPDEAQARKVIDMAKEKEENNKEPLPEMMVQGVGPPSTSNAAETMPIGDSGALLKGWEELEEIQRSAQPAVMEAIYNNGISNVGDAIQLLEMIQKDLEDQLVRSDYVKNDPYYGKDLGSRSANDMQEEVAPMKRRSMRALGPKVPIKLKLITHRRKPPQKA